MPPKKRKSGYMGVIWGADGCQMQIASRMETFFCAFRRPNSHANSDPTVVPAVRKKSVRALLFAAVALQRTQNSIEKTKNL